MKKLFRSFSAGALFALGVLSIAGSYAAVLPIFTGPTGTNPAQYPSALPDLNALVQSINSNLAAPASMAFVVNGSVATALSSVGPTGSHTTVQEWIAVTDASGTVRYVPGF